MTVQHFTGYKRVTHKYKSRWSNLDQWDTSKRVEFKLLGGKTIEPANGYDDGGKTRHTAIIKAVEGMDSDDIQSAIYDELKSDGCAHEFDCCGCYFNYVHVEKVSRKEYRVEISHNYNY